MSFFAAAVGLQVAGSLIGAVGANKAAKAQAAAARAAAAAKQEQAVELLKRAKNNSLLQAEEGKVLQSNQIASYVKSGVSLDSGSTLAMMQNTASVVHSGIQKMLDDADFEANQLRKGADVDNRLAADIRSAGKFQVAGTLLSGGASTAKMFI